MKFLLPLIFFYLLDSYCCFSQDELSLKKKKVQIGVTAGFDNLKGQSNKTVANLSLNLISSYTAAIQGSQISIFSNFSQWYLRGLQISTLINVSGTRPVKWTEKSNILSLEGAQLALLLNRSEGLSKGLQMAGFNKSIGYMQGVQVGLLNTVDSYYTGFQLGLLINNVKKNVTGLQLSAMLNFSGGQGMGTQIGLINYVKTSGFKLENTPFLQRDHLQLGLININSKSTGYMVGLINISRDNNGFPIGLINTGTKHNSTFLTIDEVADSRVIVNTGSAVYENRLSIGYNYFRNRSYPFLFSYGLEKNKKISEMGEPFELVGAYTDLVYLKEKENWSKGLWLNKIGIYYCKEYFKKGIKIYTSVSVNIGYFDILTSKLDIPIYNQIDNKIVLWPGYSVGFML